MSIKSREFKEGEKSFNNFEPAKSNPYKYPCKKWFSWFYGYMHKAIIGSGNGEKPTNNGIGSGSGG